MAGVAIDGERLRVRIERRVDAMLTAGLVEEVRALRACRELSRSAQQAIGYREVMAHLDGELALDEARQETIERTWRFARRQVRWFRRDPRITWLEADDNPCDLLPALLALWSR
jgi:tRNA dimethylallyltransferase